MNKGDGGMPVQGIHNSIDSEVTAELSRMVDEGLLNMGVCASTGEAVFWATPSGAEALGMV